MVNLSEIPTWFRGTAEGMRLIQTEEQAQQKRREEIARQLRDLDEKWAATLPGLDARVEKAREKLIAAEAAYNKVVQSFNVEYHARMSAGSAYDFERDKLRREMRSVVDPKWDVFLEEISAIEAKLCEGSLIRTHREEADPGAMWPDNRDVIMSNRASVLRKLAAVRATRPEVDRLRCESSDADKHISRMRARIEAMPIVMEPVE